MKTKKYLFCFLVIIFTLSGKAQIADSTFGTNGYIPYGVSGNSENNVGIGNNMAIQTDGKIVIAVDKSNPNENTNFWFYTYRYNPDGSPDISFGNNGVSKIFAGDQSKNKDIKIQSDGKIVVIGETEYCTGGVCGAPQFIMMRLKTDGVIDSTFGFNGKILSEDVFGTSGLFANPERVLITPSGKFLIAGRGIAGKPFVGRVNNNGTMDDSFGINGIYSDPNYATLVDLVTDNNGNTFGLMTKYNQNDTINASDTYVLKLDGNGVLDNSFGVGGKTVINTAAYEIPTSIAIRTDNKIVVVGHSQPVYFSGFDDGYGETNTGYILILNSDGSPAPIFPQGFSTYLFQGDSTAFFQKVLITSDNKMLIGGKTISKVSGNYHEKAFIALMDENGNLDSDFNGTGLMKFDYGLHSTIGSLACFFDLELLPNSQILACGYRNPIVHNTSRSLFLLKLKNSNIVFPTAINENIKDEISYTVFPNPAVNVLTVTNNNRNSSEINITIFNINGQVVLTNKFQNQNDFEINVHSFSKGIYFLKIQDENQTVNKKIIIQ